MYALACQSQATIGPRTHLPAGCGSKAERMVVLMRCTYLTAAQGAGDVVIRGGGSGSEPSNLRESFRLHQQSSNIPTTQTSRTNDHEMTGNMTVRSAAVLDSSLQWLMKVRTLAPTLLMSYIHVYLHISCNCYEIHTPCLYHEALHTTGYSYHHCQTSKDSLSGGVQCRHQNDQPFCQSHTVRTTWMEPATCVVVAGFEGCHHDHSFGSALSKSVCVSTHGHQNTSSILAHHLEDCLLSLLGTCRVQVVATALDQGQSRFGRRSE